MKPVVIGIIIKRDAGKWKILTQKRIVKDKTYDSLYDGTWEAMGETIEPRESVVNALLRGFREECGIPPNRLGRILGVEDKIEWTTGKGDQIVAVQPFCFVESLKAPQPWFGPVFVVELYRDIEPNSAKSDGEVGEFKWWTPSELRFAILNERHTFMGLHLPALEKLAHWCVENPPE